MKVLYSPWGPRVGQMTEDRNAIWFALMLRCPPPRREEAKVQSDTGEGEEDDLLGICSLLVLLVKPYHLIFTSNFVEWVALFSF